MPAELKRLSAVSARIIRLAYVSQTILRVKLSPADFARACAASRKHLIPEFVTGNALAVPLYVESLPTLVGALPDELSQHLQVHYTGFAMAGVPCWAAFTRIFIGVFPESNSFSNGALHMLLALPNGVSGSQICTSQ